MSAIRPSPTAPPYTVQWSLVRYTTFSPGIKLSSTYPMSPSLWSRAVLRRNMAREPSPRSREQRLLFRPRAPLPHPRHRLPTHGVSQLTREHHDLPAVMAVVRHIVEEVAGGVVREADDAPPLRDRCAHDAQHDLALGAEGAHGLGRRHAGAVELGRHGGVGIGALEVAQTAVVQVRDELGDGPHLLRPVGPGAPDGRVQMFDEILVYARARRIRAEQNGGWIAAGHGGFLAESSQRYDRRRGLQKPRALARLLVRERWPSGLRRRFAKTGGPVRAARFVVNRCPLLSRLSRPAERVRHSSGIAAPTPARLPEVTPCLASASRT